MNLFLLEVLAICFYFASSITLIKDIKENCLKKLALALAWLASFSHLLSLSLSTWQEQGIDFSFFHTASIISLIIAFLLLFASFSKPVEKLGIALFPIAALMLILDLVYPSPVKTTQDFSFAMNAHILSSIIAFSLLTIAAFHALLLAVQNNQLKNHNPGRLMLAFPPLQAMESLLFQMISTGLLFLSASLLSGFIFIDDLFAQHLAHKTILSIVAWIIFSGLLIGRERYGWRGKTAIRWTLYGFLSLLLAYFGSKLVLELILDKF
ncbi:phosphohydrolase [Methylococcaceae bacterium HT1]|nr:phosphohydrolase [Methylococcaceae bacterium HT1]TXL18636.1 phosphohydrolase [Methylococcaceae bacterium HT3]TXL23528.1 phosphohydrolase [Methylococcaceae bacterium HT2]